MVKRKTEVQINKKPSVKNKYSWAGLATVFFLSILVIISSFDDIPGLTGAAVNFHHIAYAQAGVLPAFEVKVGGIQTAEITILDTLKDTNIVFREEEFEDSVYSIVSVSSDDADKIGKMKLVLKLDEQKLYQLGFSLDSVAVNGKLATQTKIERGFVFYEVEIGRTDEIIIRRDSTKKVEPVAEVEEEPIEEEREVMLDEESHEEEQPKQEKRKDALVGKGFFSKVGDFFKGLFS